MSEIRTISAPDNIQDLRPVSHQEPSSQRCGTFHTQNHTDAFCWYLYGDLQSILEMCQCYKCSLWFTV